MADNSALLIWQKMLPVVDSKDIAGSLRCEIQDPLWLLSRQWQMGEFNAEDAGMAAFASIVSISSPVQRFMAAGAAAAAAYLPAETPLNALVEGVSPVFDGALRAEAGRAWKKLLVKAGKQAAWDVFVKNPLLQFTMPAITYQPDNEEINAFSNEPYEQWVAGFRNGRMVDGAMLYAALQNKKASALLGQADPVIDGLGDQWLLWVGQRLGVTLAAPADSWEADRLQYQARVAAAPFEKNTAPTPAGGSDLPDAICLDLPAHNGDLMDSWSWQQDLPVKELSDNEDPGQVVIHRNTFIPSQVSYPSMPAARWWELEDNTIDLANIQAHKTDLGMLLLSEFGLMFSCDWLLTPLVLPAGHIHQVRSLRVTDVFGVQSYVPASPQDTNWELFGQGDPGRRSLYLPSVSNTYLQGDPVEEIHFVRDEMANMVWGIETTVPDGLGNGSDGETAAARLENWLEVLAGAAPAAKNAAAAGTAAATAADPAPGAGAGAGPVSLPDIGADLSYKIGNTVPANWIPFIPLRETDDSPQIIFRRGAMPRFNGGYTPSRIHPRTQMLRAATDVKGHYDIKEQEIPAMGLTLQQIWRRTRWFDGRTVSWLAREKRIGRFTESSGLQFDQAL